MDPAVSDGSKKQQDRDLVLVETAERLRGLTRPPDLVARVTETEFAIAIFETEERSLEDAWSCLRGAASSLRLRIGASVFRPDAPQPLDELLEKARPELAPLAAVAR